MVVDVGCTVVEPTSVLVLKFPGVIATDDAFDTFQESVDVPAEATMEDDAVKEVTVGRLPFKTVTVTADDVATFANVSVVEAVSVCDPFEAPLVSHAI